MAAPPVDGKANAALIDFLAGKLGVPRRDLRLASGDAARTKRIAVRGLSKPPAAFVEEVEREG